jgi:hypothetical protein
VWKKGDAKVEWAGQKKASRGGSFGGLLFFIEPWTAFFLGFGQFDCPVIFCHNSMIFCKVSHFVESGKSGKKFHTKEMLS